MTTTTRQPTQQLVLTALMASLILMATLFFKLPIPLANGYINLGDGMIFLAVLLLGGRYGAVAASIGSALGDVFSGYAIWAPFTLVVKGGMALLMGGILWTAMRRSYRKSSNETNGLPLPLFLASMVTAVVWMLIGYYLTEVLLYANWIAPLVSILWNVGQGVVGIVLAVLIAVPLGKTPARRFFVYPVTGKGSPTTSR